MIATHTPTNDDYLKALQLAMPLIEYADIATGPMLMTWDARIRAKGITKDFHQPITRLGEGGTTGALIDLKVQIYEWYVQITRTGVWASQLHGVKR